MALDRHFRASCPKVDATFWKNMMQDKELKRRFECIKTHPALAGAALRPKFDALDRIRCPSSNKGLS
jgi:hypothetical protein